MYGHTAFVKVVKAHKRAGAIAQRRKHVKLQVYTRARFMRSFYNTRLSNAQQIQLHAYQVCMQFFTRLLMIASVKAVFHAHRSAI